MSFFGLSRGNQKIKRDGTRRKLWYYSVRRNPQWYPLPKIGKTYKKSSYGIYDPFKTLFMEELKVQPDTFLHYTKHSVEEGG